MEAQTKKKTQATINIDGYEVTMEFAQEENRMVYEQIRNILLSSGAKGLIDILDKRECAVDNKDCSDATQPKKKKERKYEYER